MIANGGNADWNPIPILDLMIERPLCGNQLPRVTVGPNYHLVMMTIARGIQADERRRAEGPENRNARNAIIDPNVVRSAPKLQSSERPWKKQTAPKRNANWSHWHPVSQRGCRRMRLSVCLISARSFRGGTRRPRSEWPNKNADLNYRPNGLQQHRK